MFVTNAGTILAGTYNNGINRTTNNGTNWTNSGTGVFGNVTIGKIGQLSNGTLYTHTLGGIFRSTDEGANWSPVTGTPVGEQYRTLLVKGGTIFLGTTGGLYQSTNNGSTWVNHSDGLLWTFLDYLAMSPDGHLYGSGGNGIYRSTQPIVTGVEEHPGEIPTAFRLEQNFPNPFNPSTNIPYQIADRQFVTLTVFDILGRQIAQLVNEEQAPGNYSIPWNAAGVSSGVYTYRLQTRKFSDTGKMLLIR